MGEVQLLRSGDEVFVAELHGWSRLEFNPFYPSFSSFSCSQKMIISNFGFAPGESNGSTSKWIARPPRPTGAAPNATSRPLHLVGLWRGLASYFGARVR